MELMSALLLCAFAATVFQQGLGVKPKIRSEIKLNTSLIIINPRNVIPRKKILLNVNSPSEVCMNTVLKKLYDDPNCKKCIPCVNSALNTYRNEDNANMESPSNSLYYEMLKEHTQDFDKNHQQFKRNTNHAKTKPNRGKVNDGTITKYVTDDGKVYAVKVNDTNTQTPEQNDMTCKIYSVKKTFPCDSDENELMLAILNAKEGKKSKKVKNKPTSSTTQRPITNEQLYKKRHIHVVEGFNIPEGFMPSVEEYYGA